MVYEAVEGIMRRIRRLEALEYTPNGGVNNILTNPGLEIWQRGVGPFTINGYTADRWQIELGAGATISVAPSAATISLGSLTSLAAAYVHAAATSRIYQNLESGDELASLQLSFAADIYAAVPLAVRLWIRDGIGPAYIYEYSQYHSGTAGWERLFASKSLRAGIDRVSVGLELVATSTIYLDNASAVLNNGNPSYVPLHHSEEWDRCLRYYETGHLCYRGYAPDNGGIWLPLTFVERKCAIPVITMSGGVYAGTVTTDILTPADENTACWQLTTTGAGLGEVADRHWIAESNCDPVDAPLYFTPGNAADWYGDGPYSTGELWKYDGTNCTFVFKEDIAESQWGENWISCIFWSQIYNMMYFCTWDWDENRIRVYSLDPATDTVTKIIEEVWPGPAIVNPIIDAAEFKGKIYLFMATMNWDDHAVQVREFDPIGATLNHSFDMPSGGGPGGPFAYTGGMAVDPANNELVAFGGYQAYYSTDGVVWNLDADLNAVFPLSADSFSMITYNGKIYVGIQAEATPMGPPPTPSVARRDSAGNWVAEYTGPYPAADDTNSICTFTSIYDSVGTEQGLLGAFWPWFYTGGGVAIRDNAGVWSIDWVGPDCNGFPGWKQMLSYAQGMAQYNGDVYGLFIDKKDWSNTSLYKRTGPGTWELVHWFENYWSLPNYHTGTLAIAASYNTLKKCHEV